VASLFPDTGAALTPQKLQRNDKPRKQRSPSYPRSPATAPDRDEDVPCDELDLGDRGACVLAGNRPQHKTWVSRVRWAGPVGWASPKPRARAKRDIKQGTAEPLGFEKVLDDAECSAKEILPITRRVSLLVDLAEQVQRTKRGLSPEARKAAALLENEYKIGARFLSVSNRPRLTPENKRELRTALGRIVLAWVQTARTHAKKLISALAVVQSYAALGGGQDADTKFLLGDYDNRIRKSLAFAKKLSVYADTLRYEEDADE